MGGHFIWRVYKFHSVRFCLSYDSLKWDFTAFKMNVISIRKCTADTDVVNDVTNMRQNIITCGHTIFMT